MTDSTMVERVARVIAGIAFAETHEGDAESEWPSVAHIARAAIEAMMEPTPALLAAQTDTDPDIARVVHDHRAKLYSEPF